MADYGDAGVNGVSGMTKPYANNTGVYDTTTNPTLAQVENWLDEISAALNMQLGNAYFVTPITAVSVKPSLDVFANQQVAKLIELIIRKRASRGPSGNNVQGSTFELTQDVGMFVMENARGFESNGAVRNSQMVYIANG